MSEVLEWLNHPFLLRTLAGAALAGFLAGFIGAWAVLRRMALVSDALSHTLFPGLVLSLALLGTSSAGLLLGGLLSALLVLTGSEFITRNSRLKPDASIAILYALSYALGSILLVKTGTRVHLEHWLFGHVMAIANADLWHLWGTALILLPLLVFLERPLALTLLSAEVARSMRIPTGALQTLLALSLLLAALASFKAAGVVPTVSLLIAPGACLRLWTDRLPTLLWGSALVGACGSTLGVVLSCLLDPLPPGACIALVLGAAFLLSLLCAPTHGWWASRPKHDHFCEESFHRWHRPIRALPAGHKSPVASHPLRPCSSNPHPQTSGVVALPTQNKEQRTKNKERGTRN